MTTDISTHSTMKDDLAFVKAVAEEGRMRPLQGGRYLVLWGCLSFVGLCITALMVTGVILSAWWVGFAIWIPLMLVGVVMSKRFDGVLAMTADGRTLSRKVEGRVWSIGGMSIGFMIGLMVLVEVLFGEKYRTEYGVDVKVLFSMISPFVLTVYAIALGTTAEAGRAKWLWKYVYIAFGLLAAAMLTIFQAAQFIVMLAGIVALVIVPGLEMLNREKVAKLS